VFEDCHSYPGKLHEKRQLLRPAWANRIPLAFSKYAGSKQMVQKYIQVDSLLAHVAAKFFRLIMFLVFN
jgi:hypothetical protein